MTANPPFRTIQLQRDTAANWTSANTLLAEGEVGLEMDTRKAKVGDWVTQWNSLGYAFWAPLWPDENYITDAEKIVIWNTSWTNSWNQTITNTSDATSHTVTLSATGWSIKLVEGTNITLDTTGTSTDAVVTISSTSTWYTDEQAQDAVGGILVDSSTIDFTYSDATPSITADIINDSVTFSKVQNISTNRILGRSTAGTGDVEELNITAIPALIGLWTSDSPQFAGVNVGHATDTTMTRVSAGKIAIEGVNVGNEGILQNSQSAAYTLVLTDAGKHIYHPSADTTARIWTIPANASVAFPIGTAVTFINDTSAGTLTIAITTDTLVLAGAWTTGSCTLTANGIATAVKVTSTRWIISWTNLT